MNSLLARQLRRLGLDPETPPAPDAWASFLERIDRSYDDAEQSRYLLERSLRLSSSEMRQMYEALQAAADRREAEQKHRLHTVVDSLDDGLCTLDPEGRVDFLNQAAARMLGCNLEAGLGMRALDRFVFWPDDPAADIDGPGVMAILAAGHSFADHTAEMTTASVP